MKKLAIVAAAAALALSALSLNAAERSTPVIAHSRDAAVTAAPLGCRWVLLGGQWVCIPY